MQDFRRLRVWNEAHTLALSIERAASSARRGHGELTRQLRRAAGSIPANIAEGAGQISDAQFTRFLAIAIGSATEVGSHLQLVRDLLVFLLATCDQLQAQCDIVRRMLIALHNRITKPNSIS